MMSFWLYPPKQADSRVLTEDTEQVTQHQQFPGSCAGNPKIGGNASPSPHHPHLPSQGQGHRFQPKKAGEHTRSGSGASLTLLRAETYPVCQKIYDYPSHLPWWGHSSFVWGDSEISWRPSFGHRQNSEGCKNSGLPPNNHAFKINPRENEEFK